MRKIIIGISFFTALGTVFHWVLVFTRKMSVEEIAQGHHFWYMSFFLVDLWLTSITFLTGTSCLKRKETSLFFGICSGASLFFVGLYTLNYGISIKRPFHPVILSMELYGMLAGILFLTYFWKKRKELIF